MKKRISVLFCILALLLCFTGCSASQKDEAEYDEAGTKQVTEFLIEYCVSADQATIEQWKSMSDFAMNQQITSAGLPVTRDSFMGTLEAWQTAVKECGRYVSHGDYNFELSKGELKVTTEAEFEKRKVDITFLFDDNLYLDSVTLDPQYSTGEILKKAGLNTLLGMGTVFSVLIFISALISLFRYIPAIQKAFTKQPQMEKPQEVKAQPETIEQATEPVTDNAELIAVIAAAIAAAEGTTTDGFVVRSIKRRPANKWN